MEIWEAWLLAVSLCADCFACTLCSGVTARGLSWKTVGGIALAFAVIQSGLLLVGWAFGNVFVGFIERISHWIGFLLLLYVGGGMLLEGIRSLRGNCETGSVRLDGLRNIVLSGVATSIDALGVGVAKSMEDVSWSGFLPLFISVFVITALSVVIGLRSGSAIGERFGRWAEVVGGVVLIGIGISLLL